MSEKAALTATEVADGLVLGVLELSVVLMDALATVADVEPDLKAEFQHVRHRFANALMAKRAAIAAD